MRTYVVTMCPGSFADRYTVEVRAQNSRAAIHKAYMQEHYPTDGCHLKRETKADRQLDADYVKASQRLRRLELKRARLYHQLKKDNSLQAQYEALKQRVRTTRNLVAQLDAQR